MFAHNFIFVLSSVVIPLILCISEADDVTYSRCAKYNYGCDPLSLQPCCDPIHSCEFDKSRKEFVCGEKTKLEYSCISVQDCFGIANAKCSTENKCVCRTNYLELNETYCARKLGGFCWMEEPCASKRAMCIDNKCQCRENYSPSEDQCLSVLEGLKCNNDRDCAQINFATCSDDKVCVCLPNTVHVNYTSCKPVLGGECATDSNCLVSNSVCKNRKCQCSPEYVTIDGDECVQPYIGMPCTNDRFCQNYLNQTICSLENECVCSQNNYYYNRTVHSPLFNMSTNYEECRAEQAFCLYNKCFHHSAADFSDKSCTKDKNCFGSLLGELCNTGNDCFPYNSVCSDNKCKCAMNYRTISTFSCLPSMLNQICWINDHCSAIANAECLNHQCTCKKGYGKYNETTCLSLLGTQCTKHDECGVQYSICFANQCECSDYFIRQSNDQCRSQLLQKTCELDCDCEDLENLYCSSYHRCSCMNNAIAVNSTTCGALLEQYCSHTLPCLTEDSVCINNKCECKSFFESFNGQCIPTRLGKSCDNDSNCSAIKYTKCNASKKCSCIVNYVSVNGALCLALLYEACKIDDDCYARNSICIDNKCLCRDYFSASNSNTRCESIKLGRRCESSEDCSKIQNSICSSDKICICPADYSAVGGFSCTPTINATCVNDTQCSNYFFRCVDGKCQCKSGYTAISASRCMETHSIYSCKEISECSDSWHWDCSENGKCVCQQYNTAISNSTCLPSLNGYCWMDNQCVAENSVCTDFRCRCKLNFVAVANNYCVFKVE